MPCRCSTPDLRRRAARARTPRVGARARARARRRRRRASRARPMAAPGREVRRTAASARESGLLPPYAASLAPPAGFCVAKSRNRSPGGRSPAFRHGCSRLSSSSRRYQHLRRGGGGGEEVETDARYRIIRGTSRRCTPTRARPDFARRAHLDGASSSRSTNRGVSATQSRRRGPERRAAFAAGEDAPRYSCTSVCSWLLMRISGAGRAARINAAVLPVDVGLEQHVGLTARITRASEGGA